MSGTQPVSLALHADLVQFMESKVASGDYASVSALVEEGVHLLQQREADSDEWIRAEVMSALTEYDADPSGGLSVEQMRMALAAERD